MPKVFAVIQTIIPVIDPQSRQVVGQDTKEISKIFGDGATLDDIHAWVRLAGKDGCALKFETVVAAQKKASAPSSKLDEDLPQPNDLNK